MVSLILARVEWSEPKVTQATKVTQTSINPMPPHRLMAAPIDAAVLDVTPVAKKHHRAIHKVVVHKKVVTHKPVVLKATGGWAQGNWSRFPASIQISALCIAHHESWMAKLWRAVNGDKGTSASGFAQWEDGSWRVQAKRAGIGTGYARAYLAPPAVQAAVFAYQAMHHGLYPWVGTNCPGT